MKKIIFSYLFIVTLFLSSSGNALAIGQITEPIVIKSALRGQEIVSKLTVLNSENKQNVIGLSVEGQIADWTVFYAKDDKEFAQPITETTVAAGVYADVAVMFKIPEDTANGEYTGQLSVMYNPNQESNTNENSSVVSQKISRMVKITVSDEEVIVLEASVIPEKFDYAPGESINVRIIYDNQSNISLTPSVQFKVKQDEKTVYNVIYPYPDGEPAVRSMSLYEIPALTIPAASFGSGEFLAELNFLRGDKTILTKYFSFSVGTNDGVAGGAAWLDWQNGAVRIVLVIILLAIAVIITIMMMKKNSRKSAE
jgi:hypothetical protein